MLPKVVIVGRPNVGKSSLLNMLAGRRISIVDPTAGVTRDRVSTIVELLPTPEDDTTRIIELIDTGGYGIEDVQNLTTDIEQQIAFGVGEADLILFVVDVQSGIVMLDQQVAQLLRTSGTDAPVIVLANKVDNDAQEAAAYEAASLGFGDALCISATTRRNKSRLSETICRRIDWDKIAQRGGGGADAADTGVLLAIVGKRNAGKSTLVNALAGEQRVIVSEVEGTTRDAVDVRFEIQGKRGTHIFTAIDTAGVRKRKSIADDIEYYSHHRSFKSIRRAGVVLFVIDAAVPISQVDKHLGREIQDHHKPVVLVINKWDLAEKKHTQDEYLEYLDKALKGLSFAPIVFISALNDEGIADAVAMAMNLYEQAGHRVTTGELNRAVKQIIAERTPVTKIGKRPKVYYVSQLDVHPPTIGFWVNKPDLFDPTYERFVINRLRDEMPWSEVPIKLLFRGRKQMPKTASLAVEEENAVD